MVVANNVPAEREKRIAALTKENEGLAFTVNEFLLEKKFLYLDEDNRLQPTPFQVKDGTFATEKDGGVEQVLVTPVGIESLRLQKKLWDKRRRRDE